MSYLAQENFPKSCFVLFRNICLLAILTMASFGLGASGNPIAGEEKAEICMECHGNGGVTEDPIVPKLNGQYADFLYNQVMQYISGSRFNTVMGKVINKVKPSNEDVADIAAYYSMLPMMSGSGDLTDVGKMGKALFFSNNCNFCHNDYDDNADIYIRKTARVGGQNKEYLYKSLKDIQEGIRRADTYNLMKRVLSQLTDDEIDALAEFLSVL